MQIQNHRHLWARILIVLGSIAMLVGALDPMEGSIIILPGSLLVALGTAFSADERRLIGYRMTVFILIAIGVGAMWGLSSAGGFGGPSGRSMWWGVLILPYLIGWSMGMWGPGSPRWLLLSAIGIGLWYLTLATLVLSHPRPRFGPLPGIIIAVLGVLTIAGCLIRLIRQAPKPSKSA